MGYYNCRLCKEYSEKKNVIFESANFFVVPSLGQIVEGYLLICSKEHFIGLGQLPKKLLDELRVVQTKTKDVLSGQYTNPIFFEHGPTSSTKKGGCCIEHAHLHAVPVNIDIFDDISKNFKAIEIKNYFPLNKQFKKGTPYFYYENQKGNKYLFELPQIIPSQYLRRLIAVRINAPNRWNWMECPGIKEFNRTIRKLKREFRAVR